jgi:hypothetical protein
MYIKKYRDQIRELVTETKIIRGVRYQTDLARCTDRLDKTSGCKDKK